MDEIDVGSSKPRIEMVESIHAVSAVSSLIASCGVAVEKRPCLMKFDIAHWFRRDTCLSLETNGECEIARMYVFVL